MADADTGPRNEAGNGDDIEEPVERLVSVAGEVHVRQKSHGSGDCSSIVWNSALRGFLEECWPALLLRETDKNTATGIDVRAGGRQNDCEKNGVQDIWESADACKLDCNHQRTRASVSVADL